MLQRSKIVLLSVVFLPAMLLPSPEKCFGQERVEVSEDSVQQQVGNNAFQYDGKDELPDWHDMVTNIPGDWARSSQFIFNKASIPTIVAIAGLTGALIISDHDTYPASRRMYYDSRFGKSASEFFVSLGDGRYHFGLAAAFATYGFISKDRAAIRTASQTVEAVLACGVVVQALKHITGRESPLAATSGSGAWHLFPNPKEYHKNQTRYYAFPSGHIATAMATLTVVTENYPEERWMRPVGYTIVGLIGLGLVNGAYHWYSDLPLGMALGYTFGMVAAHPRILKTEDDNLHTFQFSPRLFEQGGGVQLVMMF